MAEDQELIVPQYLIDQMLHEEARFKSDAKIFDLVRLDNLSTGSEMIRATHNLDLSMYKLADTYNLIMECYAKG